MAVGLLIINHTNYTITSQMLTENMAEMIANLSYDIGRLPAICPCLLILHVIADTSTCSSDNVIYPYAYIIYIVRSLSVQGELLLNVFYY